MRKILFLVSVSICLSCLLCGQVFAWSGDVYVGNTNVAKMNVVYWVQNEDGKLSTQGANEENYAVKYDDSENSPSLTLHDIHISSNNSKSLDNGAINAAIYASGNLEIILEGDNVLESSYATKDSAGIYCDRKLTFSGNGTLIAQGGTAEENAMGIFGKNGISILGGSISAKAGDVTGKERYSTGLLAYNGAIEISGGTVSAMGGSSTKNSMGICGSRIYISGGDVSATGGLAQRFSFGMYVYDEEFTEGIIISGGTIHATGGQGISSFGIYTNANPKSKAGLSIKNAQVDATTCAVNGAVYAIYSSGTVTIEDSVVNASANFSTGGNGQSFAICGESEIWLDGHVTAVSIDDRGTRGALNREPNMPATYRWKVDASDVFSMEQYEYNGESYLALQTIMPHEITMEKRATEDVLLDQKEAIVGETVSMQVDEGTPLDGVLIIGADGQQMFATKIKANTFSFEMPNCNVHVCPIVNKDSAWQNPFPDITEDDWFFESIRALHQQSLMNGTADGTFSCDLSTTRAMLMTVLARCEGVNTVGGSTWYEKGMAWAVAKGISDGSNPNAPLTREQMVTMLWRYAGSPVCEDYQEFEKYSDINNVGMYALEAVRWADFNGIYVSRNKNLLQPKDAATRAEFAVMLQRYMVI